jgi:uncharacterized membrane protein
MTHKAVITVMRDRAEVRRLWDSPECRPEFAAAGEQVSSVQFLDAPGDRGTEIHVAMESSAPGGKLGEAAQKLRGTEPLAKVKDDLRRFKQVVETGVIARSDGVPGGEALEHKLKQRPAQPLEREHLQEVGR